MGGVLALVVAALIGGGSAHAGSLADAEAALGAAPLDPKARLAFAEALASTPGREEEGVEALWWLLWSDQGAIARDVLGEMVRATPARPGWANVYAELAKGPPGHARSAGQVRAAELRARDPRLRSKAIAELGKIADPLAAVVIGDLYLDAGEPERAVAAWKKAGPAGEGRIALVAGLDADPIEGAKALVAAGFGEAAERVLAAEVEKGPKIAERSGASPAPGASDTARPDAAPGSVSSGVAAEPLRRPAAGGPTDAGATDPSSSSAATPPASPSGPLARADAQVASAEGGPSGAPASGAPAQDSPTPHAVVSPTPPVDPATARRAAAATLLGELRLARGDGEGAVRACTDAVTLDPTPAARAGLVRALLAVGRADEASRVLGEGSVPLGERPALDLTLVLARARVTTSLEDDLPAAAAAFAGAPDEVDTANFYGRLLVAAGRHAEALAPLQRAAALRPADGSVRGMLITAAVKAGEPVRGLDAAAAAVQHASDPEVREKELDSLAGLLLGAADSQRKAGATSSARTKALVALAIRPETASVARAVGGTLWSEGELEAAHALYSRALRLDPRDEEAVRAIVALDLALGRRAEAEERLGTLSEDDAGARAMRDELQRSDLLRMAHEVKDPDEASRTWRSLVQRYPGDARFLHGLADTYTRKGDLDQALTLHLASVTLSPKDPWNHIGLVGVLLEMNRIDAAEEALAKVPGPLDPEARAQHDRLRARLLRATGDRAAKAEDHVAAISRYRESHALDPQVWTTIALAGELVAIGEHVEALGYFREALASHRDDAQIDTVASRGEAGVLEAMGQGRAALAALDALAARRPDPETDRLREELRSRLAVGAADELRRTGRYADAEKALQALAVEAGGEPLVQAAWAALLLDLGRPKEAVDAAARALAKEPQNAWALQVAKRAGRSCGCSERVVALYRTAVAGGAGPEVAADLRRVRVSAALEDALASKRAHKPLDARDALQAARGYARGDAEGLLLLMEGERAFNHPKRARNALRKAWALDDKHPEVLLAWAEDMAAHGRRKQAIALLEARWASAPDHRVGELLARLRALEPAPREAKIGRKPSADMRTDGGDEHLDGDIEGHIDQADGTAPGEPEGPEDLEASLEDEELGLEDAPSFGAMDLGPRSFSTRSSSKIVKKKAEPAVSTVGFGVYSRSGVPGIGKELAGYIPVHLGPPPVGPIQLDVEAVVVRVEDGLNEKWGVAPSIGAATPLDKPWAAWLRAGMSPLGFSETPYPVWFLGGRGRIGVPLAVGLETGRAPILDSYASWVGGADFFSGQPFGQVHHTWFGGWAGVGAPWGTDVGILSRLGQSEGIELDPVGRFEVVTWLGQRIGTPSRNVRIGAEGVGFSHEKQVDGFQIGQGAFYSPPVFGVATGRLDVRWTAFEDRFSVCGGVGAGMQYAGGSASPWYMPGTTFTHNGRLRLAWRTPSEWGVMVEGSWLKAGPWHQEMGLVRFGRALDGSPPLTTFATPSAGLWYQGEGC